MKFLYSLLAIILIQFAPIGADNAALAATKLAVNDILWYDTDKQGRNNMHLYVFWSDNCPHCHRAMPFVNSLISKYPWIKVHKRQVGNSHPKNRTAYRNMARTMGQDARGAVPAFFFCGIMYTGWGEAETTGQWIIDTLKECRTDPDSQIS